MSEKFVNDNMLIDNFTLDDLPNSILRGIYQYWLDMKGDRLMPPRADLDPADIVRLLPYLTLVDVDTETGRYKFRLIGTEAIKPFGNEVTGRYLDEFPETERYIKTRYDWLVREKRPYYITGKLNWSSRSLMGYNAIGLPFSSNGKDVDILMYFVCFQSPSDLRTDFYDLAHKKYIFSSVE